VHDNDTSKSFTASQYEPPHDYDNDDADEEEDEIDENEEAAVTACENEEEIYEEEVYATTTTTVTSGMAPTAAHSHPASISSNRSVVTIGSSPLTPRQIKQRNTAKRNSISKTNGAALLCSTGNTNNSEETSHFTPTQLRDLAFLQSQRFDAEFIKTTNELFIRYPSAKISISVVNSSSAMVNSTAAPQVARQVEIDRAMFDKICAYQAGQLAAPVPPPPVAVNKPKLQPQTPVRTTSVLSETAVQGQVKSELERAIENRMRRVSLNNTSLDENGCLSAQPPQLNKRNMPRDPPPPIPQSSTCPNLAEALLAPGIVFPPPPSPKELRRLNNTTVTAQQQQPQHSSATNTVTNTSAVNNHPMNSNNNVTNKAFCPPPPPPPLPPSLSSPPKAPPPPPLSFHNMKPLTKSASAVNVNTDTSSLTNISNNTTAASGKVNVKSIVNSYQQQQQHNESNHDFRNSSDFTALIAKKAANIQAKLQERGVAVRQPTLTANAVTYQAEGRKMTVTTSSPARASAVIYSSTAVTTTTATVEEEVKTRMGRSSQEDEPAAVRRQSASVATTFEIVSLDDTHNSNGKLLIL
jgi:hypothetical protein